MDTRLNSVFRGNSAQQICNMWRPWTGNEGSTAPPKTQIAYGQLSHSKYSKTPPVIHPVKLYWPRSRCFDYLYQDAEMLLRSYPVQATICPYRDSSSEEDSDDEEEEEEEEEAEKQQN
ncbi:protein ripply2-like [Salarias fasciatus]|uniref:protein ripply2-like n=1 Tax=Salarias fasciatus TaxID=181472 RepID=UPI001176CFD6|nr:protein ripply2-like [Salarias fasciatus]